MKGNNIDLDYDPLGCVCSDKDMNKVFYVLAGVLVIAGMIVFAVKPSAAVLAVFIILAAAAALTGIEDSNNQWYWGEEKFTVKYLFSKPVTFSYNEIERTYTVNTINGALLFKLFGIILAPIIRSAAGSSETVMFCMKNGREYGISSGKVGAEEFLKYVASKQEMKDTANV